MEKDKQIAPPLNTIWEGSVRAYKRKTNWLEIIVCVGMLAAGFLIIWLALKDIV